MFAYESENPVLPFNFSPPASDFYDSEDREPFSPEILLRYGEMSPPLGGRTAFEALPFVPLPCSTAAEFSWHRNYDQDEMFDDDDSESLRSSESSNPLEMSDFTIKSSPVQCL